MNIEIGESSNGTPHFLENRGECWNLYERPTHSLTSRGVDRKEETSGAEGGGGGVLMPCMVVSVAWP